ncbi:unnamed protein product [Cyprideis torosa]|uniref:Netrin receptor UNC5 n=1 Tax=Cyprideis torosa TaxID=163714 RepID=A0A7R8W805_9CRUS|nr:unnamed protein product [Cyprideis torosa]CAG0883793.1 unnamed protein product [Cyprideis torosa]
MILLSSHCLTSGWDIFSSSGTCLPSRTRSYVGQDQNLKREISLSHNSPNIEKDRMEYLLGSCVRPTSRGDGEQHVEGRHERLGRRRVVTVINGPLIAPTQPPSMQMCWEGNLGGRLGWASDGYRLLAGGPLMSGRAGGAGTSGWLSSRVTQLPVARVTASICRIKIARSSELPALEVAQYCLVPSMENQLLVPVLCPFLEKSFSGFNIRKHFIESPYSEAVPLSRQVELRCVPPEGIPPPKLTWYKDGKPLEIEKNPNVIISSEGNLLIIQAGISDIGNYSCVAENIASRRVSETARLEVYVTGSWGSWSAWSPCSAACGKGSQQRTRECLLPARFLDHGDRHTPYRQPLAQCGEGTMRQIAECVGPCNSVVDGGWSHWGPWSVCSSDCIRFRRRSCTSPPPSNGGKMCRGKDVDTEPCNVDLCLIAGMPNSRGAMLPAADVTPQSAQQSIQADVALYVGLSIAILLFVLVALVAIRMFRHRKGFLRGSPVYTRGTVGGRGDPSGYHPTPGNGPYTPEDKAALDFKFHPISQTLDYIDPANAHDDSKPGKDSEHYYDLPVVTGATPQATPSHLPGSDATHRTDSSRSTDSLHTGTGSSNQSGYSGPAVSTASGAASRLEQSITVARVTPQGGRLNLEGSGVRLTIPPGAVPEGQSVEVFLSVLREDGDRPPLDDEETLLSPVIHIGPLGLALRKPVIVSFPHCASLQHGHWSLSVASYDDAIWKTLVSVGEETIETPIFTQLDSSYCHLAVERFARYALLGRSTPTGWAVKSLRLAPFLSCSPMAPQECSVRLYCLEDTPSALQAVVASEKKLGGRLLDHPAAFLFQDGGGGLHVSLDDPVVHCIIIEDGCIIIEDGCIIIEDGCIIIEDGCIIIEDFMDANDARLSSLRYEIFLLRRQWRPKPFTSEQEIPFNHVWRARSQGLHCSFALELLSHQPSASLSSAASTTSSKGPQSAKEPNLSFTFMISQSHPLPPTSLPLPLPRRKVLKASLSEPVSCLTHSANAKHGPLPTPGHHLPARGSSLPPPSPAHLRNPGSPVHVVSSAGVGMGRGQVPVMSTCVTLTGSEDTGFLLPVHVRSQLASVLDSPHPRGCDWQRLAQVLGMDRYLDYFSVRHSPTESILDLWEARHSGDRSSIIDLMNSLRNIGRNDAASIIESHCGPWL